MTDVSPRDDYKDDVDDCSGNTVHNTDRIDGCRGSTLIEQNLCPPLDWVTTVEEYPKEVSYTDDGISGHGDVNDLGLPYPGKDANKHQADGSLGNKGSYGIQSFSGLRPLSDSG